MNTPRAKGKLRREELGADEEALKAHEEAILKHVVRSKEKGVQHEIPAWQVVEIFASEIQNVYKEAGSPLDEANAHDKALILWRDLRYGKGIHAREKILDSAYCDEHTAT